MKYKLILAFVAITSVGHSQNFLTKVMAKVAKTMAPAAPMASSLNDVVPTVGIGGNLHPVELGTVSQAFSSNWKTGGDMVYLMFSKKSQAGLLKIDGTVTVDGAPVEYITSGMYNMITDANPKPRKVEITTVSGEKASFTIEPAKRTVKILSVNGQKDNVSLDLTKDVVIELEGANASDNLKVSLAINQVSIKSLYEVCYIKSGAKITIPAAAFRNINIVPGGSAIYNYKKSFISLAFESVEKAKDVSGAFSEVKYISSYSDGKFVNVTKEPELNTGMVAKGSEDFKNGAMEFNFFKPGAFVSRPVSQLKKIGVESFSIRGTTFAQTTSGNALVTVTKTMKFPQQSDETWDALLAKMYPEFIAVIEKELAPVLPLETVTNSDSYKTVNSFSKDDANTKVEFSRAYKNSKVISAFMPVSEGYGVNGVNERLLNETGSTGLLTLTIDLQVETDKDNHIIMSPRVAFEIIGKSNGTVSNTKYYSGTVTGKGLPFNEKMAKEELESIIRSSDLVAAFAKGLRAIKEKEKANTDYETVWNLQ